MSDFKLSIVIAAHNVENFIERCLETAYSQTYKNVEIIVVDDASSDATGRRIEDFASRHAGEGRAGAPAVALRCLRNPRVVGTHATRRRGVEAATGDHVFFLDGDDELRPDMCQQLVDALAEGDADIIHYGLTVVAANGLDEDERTAFADYNNAEKPALRGAEILRKTFVDTADNKIDWRFTQRLYRAPLLKRAMAASSNDFMAYNEDGYECFLVTALARSYRSLKTCRGYVYHYGRGVCGPSSLDLERFGSLCRQTRTAIDAAAKFVDGWADADAGERRGAEGALDPALLHQALHVFQRHSIELLANEAFARLSTAARATALRDLASAFGAAYAHREVYRQLRDRAYAILERVSGPICRETVTDAEREQIEYLQGLLEALPPVAVDGPGARYCQQMRDEAQPHLDELEPMIRREVYDSQPIRIFVTTHKDVVKPAAASLQLVQVGPQQGRARLSEFAYQDNEGENISDRNPHYCELTTQYWAYKNVQADYYGFCHYRRYFNFSGNEYPENPYGEVMADAIDAAAVRRFGLDDASIARAVEGYDVVTTRWQDLRRVIDRHGSPRALWQASPSLHERDLRLMQQALHTVHPEYDQDVSAYLDGHTSCFCNMFIMKRAIFMEYCEWLFGVLAEYDRICDMDHYSKEALRTPGHLAERLLNIYIMHKQRTGAGWRMRQLQCVHFRHPEPVRQMQPLDPGSIDPAKVVPVVFAADNNYVPQLTTTIYSVMTNADPQRYYDVVILHKDIDTQSQSEMREFFGQFSNMRLSFVDVWPLTRNYKLTTSNAHISVETYYRFLIQGVLPFYQKILYLDSDIVVQGDVARLFDTDLQGKLLAACRDIDFLANLNLPDGKRMRYATDKLGMAHPYEYFQAGVLVLNTRAMRERYTIEQWLTYASNPDFIYNDQDVLNSHCQGDVLYLDWSWNVVHDCGGRVGDLFPAAPAEVYDAYMRSRSHPKIIHYAGYEKPWVNVHCDYAPVYWRYVRETPFYELMLQRAVAKAVGATAGSGRGGHASGPLVGQDSPIRKAVDLVLPPETGRRMAVRAVLRRALHRD